MRLSRPEDKKIRNQGRELTNPQRAKSPRRPNFALRPGRNFHQVRKYRFRYYQRAFLSIAYQNYNQIGFLTICKLAYLVKRGPHPPAILHPATLPLPHTILYAMLIHIDVLIVFILYPLPRSSGKGGATEISPHSGFYYKTLAGGGGVGGGHNSAIPFGIRNYS